MSATYKLVRDGAVYDLGEDLWKARQLVREFGGRLITVEGWAPEDE
jgi:hypothetical protein